MIVCDKCGAQIEESALLEGEESEARDKPEDGKKKRFYKKEQQKEEPPTKRTSLVSMPYGRGVNGFTWQEIDLCETCRALLGKQIEKVKFQFLTGGG